jgi:hypothetical protein
MVLGHQVEKVKQGKASETQKWVKRIVIKTQTRLVITTTEEEKTTISPSALSIQHTKKTHRETPTPNTP